MSEQEFQAQVLQSLDKLGSRLDNVENRLDKLENRLDKLENRLDHLEVNLEKFNDKFSNYQQAIQWVVQLSFTLIASATVTVIISSVLGR
ncbi:MAG: hypothetical protein ACK421_09935 [Pseudanabaenaceae cyanobacterium]